MYSLLKTISIEPVVLFYVFAIFAEYDCIGDIFYVSKCIDHLKLNNTNDLHFCTSKNKSSPYSTAISKEANKAQVIYNGILYSTSIISSLVVASYADRRTKFLPIILPLIGSALVQVLILFSFFITGDNGFSFIFTSNGHFILFICSFISGITGGTTTLLSNCFAHVAENCDERQRTSRITIIEACLFGGGFFGFTMAGKILRSFPNSINRYNINFAIFFLIHLSLILYVVYIRKQFRKPHNLNHSSMTFNSLLTSIFKCLCRPRLDRKQNYMIYLILFSFVIISYWNVAIISMLFIYTRNLLHWETWKYSYFSSAKFGICGILLCLLPAIQYILTACSYNKLSDGLIISAGLLSRGFSIIFIGLSSLISPILMIVALACIIFAEYPIPAIRSLMSKIIEPYEKAQMFTLMSTLQSICFFTGSTGFLSLYNSVLEGHHNTGPAWIFIIIGLFQFLSMLIIW